MCGICGLAGHDAAAVPMSPERLFAMTEAIVHRGPDEAGHLREPGVALGMRRLSVIDLAASHQPVFNEDRSVQAVFNGEIFNYRELRSELIGRGHRFVSSGDTETIVHLFEEHGRDFVKRLRGMFAIAVWDSRNRTLILARDRLGVKPLYYTVTSEGLAFASEVKCLLAAEVVEPALDPQAAVLLLSLGYVPGPRTLFRGVFKLPPATTLAWRLGELGTPQIYWSPDDPPLAASESWEADEERLMELLRSAVTARMVSDVPLGVMLSGGLDSSLIAALMAEAGAGPLETFSVGFVEDADANELQWAQKTATRLGSNHHALLTSASEHPGLLDEALWHLEEPIADLSFLGFLLLSRLARERVTVALCGQAADELLGGYKKHLVVGMTGWADRLPRPASALLSGLAGSFAERAPAHRLLSSVAESDDLARLAVMSGVIPPRMLHVLLTGGLQDEDPARLIRDTFAANLPVDPGLTRLTRTLLTDLRFALPDLMFVYFDKMSMATSLEVRVPFADHDLVNFCMALPDSRRILRRRGKEILRRISADLVDESIINRPKRGFFKAASSSWLTHNLDGVRDVLLDPRCAERGLFDPASMREWLGSPLGTGRDGEPLLIAFMLETWHRHFIDPDGFAHGHLEKARAAGREAARQEIASR